MSLLSRPKGVRSQALARADEDARRHRPLLLRPFRVPFEREFDALSNRVRKGKVGRPRNPAERGRLWATTVSRNGRGRAGSGLGILGPTRLVARWDGSKEARGESSAMEGTYEGAWTALKHCDVEDVETACTTGFAEVDELVDGGIRPCQHVELAGMPATGKTQICMAMAASNARNGSHVVYVDTQNAFHVRRAAQLAKWDLETKEERERVLANIHVVRLYDLFDAFQLLDALGVEYAMRNHRGIKESRVLIVDSLSSLISPHLGAGTGLGYALMIALAHSIRKLAHAHRVAVLSTNHLVKQDVNETKHAVPALGEGWVYQPHTRLMLTREDHEGEFKPSVQVTVRVSHSCLTRTGKCSSICFHPESSMESP